MSFQRRIGEHELCVDDSEIMKIVFRGVLGPQDMQEILQEHDGKLLKDGDLFVISDLRALTTVEPGARHALGARSKALPGYCVAFMVPNFQIRVLIEVLSRATSLLLKVKVHHHFFDDETLARQWLLEMQRSRR